MRRASCLLFLAACGGGGNSPMPDAPAQTGAIVADVTHYDYTLNLDTQAAHAQVVATVETGGDCLTLPFRGASLDTHSVMLDGVAAASATVADGALTACGAGVAEGATLTLDADVHVALGTLDSSDVGYAIQHDGSDYIYYLVSWVNGCDQFTPCDPRPDQFATYTFHVTHMPGYTVRCPGTIDESDPDVTVCDFPYGGGPTYSTFGLIAAKSWTVTDKGTFGGVHVTVYDRASTGITAAIDTAYHDGFLTWMEGEFGPYPYGSDLRILTAPTYWNGFEHPGNIVLNGSLAHQPNSGYADNVAHTLDHEMTHMWAGDQTTIAGTYDFAWKESMAEYLPFVYEDTGDHAVGLETAHAWKNDAAVAVHPPVPDDMPALFDFYADVYGAGPMILFRQTEVMFGRDKVLAAMQSLLGSQRAISVDDVVAALSAQAGTDLTAYAASWLHGTGAPQWPTVAATFTPGSGSGAAGQLAIEQTSPGQGSAGCMFHVALVGSGGESTEVAVDTFGGGAQQTIDVPTPAYDVTSTVIDPEHECLVYPAAANAERATQIPATGRLAHPADAP